MFEKQFGIKTLHTFPFKKRVMKYNFGSLSEKQFIPTFTQSTDVF